MSMLDDALGVLLGEDLAHVVDMALCRRDGLVEANARDGAVGFTAEGLAWERGRNPLARQDPSTFPSLAEERAAIRPDAVRNAYPFAYDNAAHLFDDPRAPDIAVVHTPAHNWEARGGHRGEHGSLDVVQSRAPLILAGRGIRPLGRIAGAARMIDIAPTIAALAGIEPDPAGRVLPDQPGRVLTEVIDPDARPDRVVAFLCDGTNANVLAARADAGELPAVARMMQEGTTFAAGCIASFPSVTLANHTTALTGVHPGRHSVLHNFYFDRATGRRILTNAPETWHRARDEIATDVRTLFEVLGSAGLRTAAINEPADRGATYASFDLVRAGMVTIGDGDGGGVPAGATEAFASERGPYRWSSVADELAIEQVRTIAAAPEPTAFVWINVILPDAANHAGGPYSSIADAGWDDTDRRIAAMRDLLDDGRTAFLLLADHGMEETDPTCIGDWKPGLTAAGIPFRDEGEGFLYLGA